MSYKAAILTFLKNDMFYNLRRSLGLHIWEEKKVEEKMVIIPTSVG